MPHSYFDLLALVDDAEIVCGPTPTDLAMATIEMPPGNGQPSISPHLDVECMEADDDPHRLARLNLERHLQYNGVPTLRYWRGEWYMWKGNCYRKWATQELRANVSLWIREEFERIHFAEREAATSDSKNQNIVQKVSSALVTNVLEALSGLCCVAGDLDDGSWLPTQKRQPFISLANGILNIEAVMGDQDDCLRPNTPEWFSQVTLPYQFDPSAGCPRWNAFLEHNLESDAERTKVLQEWAGYLLLPDTGEQKFMVLEGEGANGKSVFLSGVTAMLGEGNVSNVPLEIFGGRFALTSTLGKLLNACGDAGEIDKTAEGLLKTFTGGDRMFFDRKGVSGINARPTARLMIACNNRPRFSDHSEGIWRRMLLVPWRVRVTRENRNRRMIDPAWWKEVGELPGIFRWALAGLARLRAQGGFTQSVVMDNALANYQDEMNPARVFLTENTEVDLALSVRCKDLYRFYKKWSEESGYRPMADRTFGREVHRRFPSIKRHSIGTGSNRAWIYTGIKFSADEIAGEKTEEATLF